MHNGAFVRLEDAIRHHLDAYRSARDYQPVELDEDLRRLGPIEPVLARLDPLISDPPELSRKEFDELVEFVEVALTDPQAKPDRLERMLLREVPSRLPVHDFRFDKESE